MHQGVLPSKYNCRTVGGVTRGVTVNDRKLDVVPFNGNTRHIVRGGRAKYTVRNVGFGVRGQDRVIHTTRRNVIFSFHCNVSMVGKVNVRIDGVRTNETGVFLDPVFHGALTKIAKTIVRLCRASNSINTTGKTNVNTNVCGSDHRTFTSLRGLAIVRPSVGRGPICRRTCRH